MWFLIPVGLLIVLGASAVAWYIWNEVKGSVKGANVVIIGPRKSGKTTLFRFMSSETRIDPKAYNPTKDSPRKRVDLDALRKGKWSDLEWLMEDLELDEAEIKDTPGGRQGRGYGFKAAQNASVLVFMADASLAVADGADGEAYRQATLSDARQVGSWDRVANGELPVVLVLSHMDEVAMQSVAIDKDDYVLGHDDIVELRRALRAKSPGDTVAGNLLNDHDACNVALHILRAASEAAH